MEPGTDGYEQTGILRYDGSSTDEPTTMQWKDISLSCSDETYTSLHPVVPWLVGKPSDDPPGGEKFNIGKNKKGYPLSFWNLGDDKSPALRVDYSNVTFLNLGNKGSWNNVWRIEPEDFNSASWVYLVIQSPKGHNTGSHPIHLHGHDFAILEQAANKTYNVNTTNLLLINPPRRDVVLLPKDGYVVMAFKADNPGAWLVHCHIAFHIAGGLGLQILEDQQAAAKLWPKGSKAFENAERVCKNWDKWYANPNNRFPQPNCNDAPDICFQNDSGV